MLLRIAVFLQLLFMEMFAEETTVKKIGKLDDTFTEAAKLFTAKEGGMDGAGPIFSLISYVIIVIGLIFMGIGINDAFIAEDRGGENKKGKGILKIIGGALFISIILLYDFVADAGVTTGE